MSSDTNPYSNGLKNNITHSNHQSNSNSTPNDSRYNINARTYIPGVMTYSAFYTFPGQHNFYEYTKGKRADVVLLIKDARASYAKYNINTTQVVYHSMATVCSRALVELESEAEGKRSADVVVEELMMTLENIWVVRKKV
jgi:hypothetical protein